MNLSFAGCGFLGIYHVGVASCFKEYAPHVIVNKIAGASVGSIAAAALICDVSLGQTTTDILSIALKARSPVLGPLSPRFDLNKLVAESLDRGLPRDAHVRCNGRLFISVTRMSDKKNVLLSEYNTRQELIQALICSCFIPYYSGITAPTFRGVQYVDGGLSDNLPVLDENTITVSPFAGEHDICPQDKSCNILQVNVVNTSIAISAENIYRFYRILFPPKPEILSKMCQQGFDDALKYLQRKNVISCTRCLGVQSSLMLAETKSESSSDRSSVSDIESDTKEHLFDDCIACKARRQQAHSSNLPAVVVNAIEEVCEQVNKGLINWLLRLTPVKWLSYLGKPYIVPMAIPVDITLVILSKVYEKLPDFRGEIQSKFSAVHSLIKQTLSKVDRDRHLYSAKFSCQLAITEFDYTEDNVVSSYAFPLENSQPHDTCIIKTEEEKVPKRKLSFKVPESSVLLLPASDQKQQRKSYAGFHTNVPNHNTERVRRKSLTEISNPERVIRNMKFGFTVDLMPTVTTNDTKKNVVEALQSLGEEDNELNVIELANKALSMEREFINQHHEDITTDGAETLGQILSASKSEALMSYYYVDEDKSVKITELYNVTDADSSVILPDEEREVNSQLSWDQDWISIGGSPSCHGMSIADTLDDREFVTSDDDTELHELGDNFNDDNSFQQLCKFKNENAESNDSYVKPPPRRKNSFIIVN